MKKYFITATGTGIGKTLLTCALAYQLQQQGKTVRAIKPIISGFDVNNSRVSDTGLLLAAQNIPISPQAVDAISPWRFTAPISPDMAAEDEGRSINFEQLIAFCKKQNETEYLLIEGVGGVMVPLTSTQTVLDWMLALQYPVILVAGSYLGTLSHTLACANIIMSAGLPLHTIVISQSEYSPVSPERTKATLQRFLPPAVRFASMGKLDSSAELWSDAPELTHTMFHD